MNTQQGEGRAFGENRDPRTVPARATSTAWQPL